MVQKLKPPPNIRRLQLYISRNIFGSQGELCIWGGGYIWAKKTWGFVKKISEIFAPREYHIQIHGVISTVISMVEGLHKKFYL